MANEANVRESVIAIKKESTFNTDPTIAATDVIAVADIEIDDEYNEEDYTEITNTKEDPPGLRSTEKTPGSITLNLRTCQTAGTAPEGDVLYESALGDKVQSTASVCGAGSSTSVVNVKTGDGDHFHEDDLLAVIVPTATTYTTDTGSSTTSIILTATPSSFSVGDVIQVPNGDGTALLEATQITAINSKTLTVSPALTGAPNVSMTVKLASIEIVRIDEIATDALTVSPVLTAAPDQYSDLRAGTFYKPTLDELPSFWLNFWRGNVVLEEYGGVKVDKLDIDIQAGKIIQPKFSFGGVSCVKAAGTYGLADPTLVDDDPIVALNQSIKVGGTVYNCNKFAVGIENEIYNEEDINSEGLSNKIQTGRKVSGSFSMLYRSLTAYTAFKNATTSEVIIVIGKNDGLMKGNVVVIWLPRIRYTKAPIKADSKIYKYDIAWETIRKVGRENSVIIGFL